MDGLRGTTYWDVVWMIGLFLIVPIGVLIATYVALVRAWDRRRAFRPSDKRQAWHALDESPVPAMRRDDFYGPQASWTDEEPQPTTGGFVGADAPGRTARGAPGTRPAIGRPRGRRALIGGATMAAGVAIVSGVLGMGSGGGVAVVLVLAAVVIGWALTPG